MKQVTFTDIGYGFRKKKTKREEFPEIMDGIVPWDEWVSINGNGCIIASKYPGII